MTAQPQSLGTSSITSRTGHGRVAAPPPEVQPKVWGHPWRHPWGLGSYEDTQQTTFETRPELVAVEEPPRLKWATAKPSLEQSIAVLEKKGIDYEHALTYQHAAKKGYEIAADDDLDSTQIEATTAPWYRKANQAATENDHAVAAEALGMAHGIAEAARDKRAYERSRGLTPRAPFVLRSAPPAPRAGCATNPVGTEWHTRGGGYWKKMSTGKILAFGTSGEPLSVSDGAIEWGEGEAALDNAWVALPEGKTKKVPGASPTESARNSPDDAPPPWTWWPEHDASQSPRFVSPRADRQPTPAATKTDGSGKVGGTRGHGSMVSPASQSGNSAPPSTLPGSATANNGALDHTARKKKGKGTSVGAPAWKKMVRPRGSAEEQEGRPRQRRRAGRFPWARRRAALIAIGVAAGLLGGGAAAASSVPHYSATATVLVQSGTATVATASANGATQLATTYAALIPQDQALVRGLARQLGVADSAAQHMLFVQAISGTALIDVRVEAPTAHLALSGTHDLVAALTSPTPPGHAIAPGSVSVVSGPTGADRSGGKGRYLIAFGALLGLVVGCLAALVAERVDRRVDGLGDLSAATGCAATRYPSGLPLGEVAHLLRRTGAEHAAVLPMRKADEAASRELARALCSAWDVRFPDDVPAVTTCPAFEVGAVPTGAPSWPAVLLVAPGERVAEIEHAVARLTLAGRAPTFAVLSEMGRRAGAAEAQDLFRAPNAVQQWST